MTWWLGMTVNKGPGKWRSDYRSLVRRAKKAREANEIATLWRLVDGFCQIEGLFDEMARHEPDGDWKLPSIEEIVGDSDWLIMRAGDMGSFVQLAKAAFAEHDKRAKG